MEWKEDSPTDIFSSKTFKFSDPISPTKLTSPVFDENQVSDTFDSNKDAFTFATPTIISQPDQNVSEFQSNSRGWQYKPKISRVAYKPAVNVFAQALKDTAMFEQLKKNSKSQVTKIDPENSITCINVPQSLLTKVPAKEYFNQFGNLLKITIRPKKHIITVIYATKEEASIAYNQSGEYMGEKFDIEWTKSVTSPKCSTKKKDLQKNFVSKMMPNFFKSPDNEIKYELDAMMNLEYNLHDRSNDGTPTKRTKALQSKALSKSASKLEKAKSEKHKSDSQISDLLPNATIEELQSIIRQPAHTSEDRYKVLEARDRLMRMKQVKSHTLAAAKVMIGSCPDMCPEKERLMREANRQLAVYEQLEGNDYKINHMKAVKQYSRSSADQEEPMSHELRPVKSLKMTMSYLLREIAHLIDQQGTNLGEWYHFLWDRTRGIRKDITQQELCCTDSVELVEQCARFHIVCSERLCAEEPSIFDKKINSDNLTKCLQSLKYMYHDLRVKGISCKNEPEFRAYIILLNLNNGNFMWDLQKLPQNIQKSSEVQFALKVYSSLESNNYYKFFKLVQKTTYLNACILLRYFNQVRLRAMSVLVKAYCRTTSTAYPLYELIDILGFEDENNAIYFFEQVGLNAAEDGLHIMLNRRNFAMPIINIKQTRAYNLIESKMTVHHISIGQCIAGGKMPEKSYKYHKPHNSFDAHGYLKVNSVKAEDQTKCDPYEFIDEDTVKDGVKKVSDAENMIVSEQTNAVNFISTTETNTNVFATTKSVANVFFASKPQVQISKFPTITNIPLMKPKKEIEKDLKPFSVASKQQSNESHSSSVNRFGATSTSKAFNIFSKKPEQPLNSDASPFVTSANQILPSISQGNMFTKSVASAVVQTVPKVQSIISSTASINEDTLKVTQNFFASTVETKKQTLLEEKAKERLKLEEEESLKKTQQINETAKEILNSLRAEVIEACCSAVVKEELHKIRIRNERSENINREILNEVIHEICDDTLREEINAKKLQEVSIKIKNRTLIRYFNIWKCNVSKRKQQRKALEDTPVWLQKRSSQECAKLLYSKEQNLVIDNMRKKQKSEDKHVTSYSKSLIHIEVIIYIGIRENLKFLDTSTQSNYYWKLVISWPDLHNKPILWHHKKVLNQYLCPEDYIADPIIKLYHPNQIEALHVCIRNFEGLISDYNLVGSDALLFIADASEEIKFISKRLTKTVLSRDRLMPIPLVFIIFGDSNIENRKKEIVSSLEQLLESGYLSIYTIVSEKDLTEETILHLTQSAVLWLSMNKSPQNPLEMDYLQDICDICLTEELWLRIFHNSSFHEKLMDALEKPQFLIDLHNETVNYLMDIILDPESFMYTKFAPELRKYVKNEYMIPCTYEHFDDFWKNEDYKAKLEEALTSFKLPEWKYPWPISDSTVLHRSIANYCQEALFTSNGDDISYNLLSNLYFTPGTSTVTYFIDVLLHIIKRKICFIDKNLKVTYNKNHIKRFRTLPWWLKSYLLTEYEIIEKEINIREAEVETEKKNNTDEPVIKRRRSNRVKDDDIEFEPLATFCENTQNQVMQVHCVSKKIEERLREQRQASSLLEEKLKNALFGEI